MVVPGAQPSSLPAEPLSTYRLERRPEKIHSIGLSETTAAESLNWLELSPGFASIDVNAPARSENPSRVRLIISERDSMWLVLCRATVLLRQQALDIQFGLRSHIDLAVRDRRYNKLDRVAHDISALHLRRVIELADYVGCIECVQDSRSRDRKSTRLNSSHSLLSRMPSSA